MQPFNTGKISIKKIIALVVVVGFCLMLGCQAPFMARYVQGKVKIGMTISEVNQLLSSGFSRIYEYCSVTDRQMDTLSVDRCEKLISTMLDGPTDSVRMTVIFMGPVFMKNDFSIIFGNDGKVKEVTLVRSWD